MARIGPATFILLTALAFLPPFNGAPPLAAQQSAGVGGQLESHPNDAITARPPTPATDTEAVPSPKSPLANLAWLAGDWQGQWGQRLAEQHWMPARAGLMVGTFRLVENRKTFVLELFTILEKPGGGVELRLRHFTPELTPWDESRPALLHLVASDRNKFVFENYLDSEPKHAIFTRLDDDTYVLRSEFFRPGGALQVTEITYHRLKPSALPKPHKWFGFGNAEDPSQ